MATQLPWVLPHQHGPHALVGQQLHEDGVLGPAVDDVRRPHALRQAPDAALDLRARSRRPVRQSQVEQ